MKNRKIASLKISKLKIDIYDYEVLDHILAYIFGLNESNSMIQSIEKDYRLIENLTVKVNESETIPTFLENNPWLKILAKRGKEY